MILPGSLKNFDWILLAAVGILTALGVMMIYSTGFTPTGLAGERALWIRQIVFFAIGFVGLAAFSFLNYRFWLRAATPLYFFTLFLLLAVLVFGQEIRGSTRWFTLGPVNFQPAELAKLAMIVVLAKYFQASGALLKNFRFVLVSLLLVALPAALIMLEPDLGSALVLFGIWVGLLVVAAVSWRHILYLFLIFALVSGVGWQFFLADYQKDRVATFLDPTADPQGRGYNVIQSMVAVGSGGVWGHGLTRGLQSQLRFLPERQTDFIFAGAVEELGLVGGGFVLLLFAVVVFRILRIMRRCPDGFGRFLAAGIFCVLLIQLAVNVGMNLGLLPVTGITLPFMSYGGTSLIVDLAAIGILQSIHIRQKKISFK